MTTTTSMPYDWLKQIPTALLNEDEIPLIGQGPIFPWELLSKGLSEVFDIKDFKITHAPFLWRSPEELYLDMGKDLTPLSCTIPTMDGEITWLMADDDIHRLISLILDNNYHEHDILEDSFLSGFYLFSVYEAIHALNKLDFGKLISPHVQETTILPNQASLCTDVEITLRGSSVKGRIIISSEFRRSWKEKYAERTLELPIKSPLAEKIMIPVHLEVGKIEIKQNIWKEIKAGDFVLLDSCTIDPNDDKGGRVTLTVNHAPFFIGKLKSGNIKILDHPLYHPEDTEMPNIPNESDETEFSSFDFDTEELGLESEMESEFESDIENEVESEYESEVENTNQDKDIEDEIQSEIESEISEDTNLKDSLQVKEETSASLKIDEVPLSIVLEVGRLKMSLKKLMELQPGNLLELNIRPENGIDLVLHGKRIAKGELIKLGDALGVRILDIG